jgi:hypothetical protein
LGYIDRRIELAGDARDRRELHSLLAPPMGGMETLQRQQFNRPLP